MCGIDCRIRADRDGNRVGIPVGSAQQRAQRAVKVAEALLFRIAGLPVQVPQRMRKRGLLGEQQHRYGQEPDDQTHAPLSPSNYGLWGKQRLAPGVRTPRSCGHG